MPLPRLSLTADVGRGPLDGAWWPRCDALELELPSLVGFLYPGRDTAVHVTVDSVAWPDAPHTVMAPGQVIDVESADAQGETHVITLDCDSMGRWVLLVVPSDEPDGTAARLLATAADSRNTLSAARMLALAETGRLPELDREPE